MKDTQQNPFRIAIASGKGGTGKTSVSVALFDLIKKQLTNKVQLVDCDVEEPNSALFFRKAEEFKSDDIFQKIPEINTEKCTFCRKCVEYCEFNAIVMIPPVKFAEVNKSLCHSCGACSFACNFDAITEKNHKVGNALWFKLGNDENAILSGKLEIGSAMQTFLIGEVKKIADKNRDIILFDSPPGTSCPVVETVANADFVILVAEPTPFGIHDLKLTIELLNEIKKDFAVVINKKGLGGNELNEYLISMKIPILGEIPFMRSFAANYAKGDFLNKLPKEMEISYLKILEKINQKLYASRNYGIKR